MEQIEGITGQLGPNVGSLFYLTDNLCFSPLGLARQVSLSLRLKFVPTLVSTWRMMNILNIIQCKYYWWCNAHLIIFVEKSHHPYRTRFSEKIDNYDVPEMQEIPSPEYASELASIKLATDCSFSEISLNAAFTPQPQIDSNAQSTPLGRWLNVWNTVGLCECFFVIEYNFFVHFQELQKSDRSDLWNTVIQFSD